MFLAQQDAQRAQYIVERAKQERQQKIVQAEGEAEIARTISFLLFWNMYDVLYTCDTVRDAYSGKCRVKKRAKQYRMSLMKIIELD